MKTLTEVIKACEETVSDVDRGVDIEGCFLGATETRDALHYLKTIETTENLYHDAVNELSKWKDEDWKDRCFPLTWDELKQMEGKPAWIEDGLGKGEWYIIEFFTTSKRVIVHDRWADSLLLERSELGKSWQAYRKER